MESRATAIVGRVLVYLVVLVLLADGITQLLLPPFMAATMQGSQFPLTMAPALGTITVACAVILAIPRLAVLGAILVTGFLGGLTTFSTFSAEVVGLVRAADYGWAVAAAGAHLLGSLLMTALGIWTIQKLAA